MAAPSPVQLSITRGGSLQFVIERRSGGSKVSLTGGSVSVAFAASTSSPIVLQGSTGDGRVAIVDGKAEVNIPGQLTDALDPEVKYIGSAKIVYPNSRIEYLSLKLTVSERVGT